jgi:hypothetical protein
VLFHALGRLAVRSFCGAAPRRWITQVERLARDKIVVEPLQYCLWFAVIASPTPALILQTETFDIPDA